jgi:hypothetical protein
MARFCEVQKGGESVQWKSFYSKVGVCRRKYDLEPVAAISCGALALLYLSGSY